MKKNNVQKNAISEAIEALDEIVKTKGIKKEEILQAFEAALVSACKKDNKGVLNVRSEIDRESYEIELAIQKEVVEEVEDEVNQISLEDARKVSLAYEIGDMVEFPVDPSSLGRVATQNAKQYVLQQLKESERNIIYNEFVKKREEVLVGVIQRTDRNNVFVDLGKVEAVMSPQNQVPTEQYLYGMRMKVYVTDVVKTNKGPQVFVSRASTGLIRRLFEMEIPEVYDGTVLLKSVVREAGSRTKISVFAYNPDIDAVGACVGQRGLRIQNILNEIGGEKIDVIQFSNDPVVYITNAVSPAEVLDVIILDEEQKSAVAIVDDSQLSLAIGKDGQNVRLAAKLTGWKIDIKTPKQYEEMKSELEEMKKLESANAIFADDSIDEASANEDEYGDVTLSAEDILALDENYSDEVSQENEEAAEINHGEELSETKEIEEV